MGFVLPQGAGEGDNAVPRIAGEVIQPAHCKLPYLGKEVGTWTLGCPRAEVALTLLEPWDVH